MRENGMWHFSTHEVGMKTDETGNIIEVKTEDYDSPEYTVIKISTAILSALKNNEQNVFERVNFLYKKKIFDIINKKNEEENLVKQDKHEEILYSNNGIVKAEELTTIDEGLKTKIINFGKRLTELLLKNDTRGLAVDNKN